MGSPTVPSTFRDFLLYLNKQGIDFKKKIAPEGKFVLQFDFKASHLPLLNKQEHFQKSTMPLPGQKWI